MSRARDNANLGAQAGSGLDASDITSGALGASVTGGAGLAVSTATTTALNLKAPLASPTFTGNFTSVGIDDNAVGAVAITIDANENVVINNGDLEIGRNATGYANGIATYYSTTHAQYSWLDFNTLMLGNNGVNKIVAGTDQTGGDFEFYVNNTASMSGNTDTDGTLAMAIDSSGNVGIGDTSPACALVIKGPAEAYNNQTEVIRFERNAADIRYNSIFTQCSASAADANIQFRVHNGGSGDSGGGANTEQATVMTLTGAGYVGIGRTDPGFPLDLRGDWGGTWGWRITNQSTGNPLGWNIAYSGKGSGGGGYYYQCEDSNGDRARLTGAGSYQSASNSYGSTSDIRIKTEIVDATPKLAELNNVKIKNFKKNGDDTKQLGVIADELELIFPNMVEAMDTRSYDDDGNVTRGYIDEKAVKYSVFVPMLIKAIQELSAKVTALENA